MMNRNSPVSASIKADDRGLDSIQNAASPAHSQLRAPLPVDRVSGISREKGDISFKIPQFRVAELILTTIKEIQSSVIAHARKDILCNIYYLYTVQ